MIRYPSSLLLAAVTILAFSPTARAQPRSAAASASAPYYAALVASARGNIDGTNRQLLLLAARWDAAVRDAKASVPAALRQDPAWSAALDRATALLSRARERARARDVAGAHGDLEEMRLMLHEIRERHGLWFFDDHLAEYHEAVERVTGHVSGRSEINFTAKDYQDVDEDLRAAQASWAMIEKTAGAVGASAGWQAASRETAAALQQISRAVAAKDRDGVATGGERLKTSYLELLSAIAKARS